MLPQLQEQRRILSELKRGDATVKQLKAIDDTIAKITASTASPTLVDLLRFKARPTLTK